MIELVFEDPQRIAQRLRAGIPLRKARGGSRQLGWFCQRKSLGRWIGRRGQTTRRHNLTAVARDQRTERSLVELAVQEPDESAGEECGEPVFHRTSQRRKRLIVR